MKSTVLLFVFAGLMSIGAAVMAEPITRAEDSVPVTIDIAKWVWVDIVSDEGFLLDYEAATPYAMDTLPFKVGHNCDASITGSLVPPPGAPGTWSWWFQEGHSPRLRLLLDGPVTTPDVQHDAGVYEGHVNVKVSGIRITNRATTYTDGTLTITVSAL